MKRKFQALLLIIATSAGAETVRFGSKTEVTRPFGIRHHPQPPPTARTIVVTNPKFEMKANQTCGYTDWTSTLLTTSKDLVSGKFLKRLGENFRDSFIQNILAVSGALPQILACNGSATFCEVVNFAQLLAQGEAFFTMDTCEIIDGVASSDYLTWGPLKDCMKCQMDRNSGKEGYTASHAREACIRGTNSGHIKKDEKLGNVQACSMQSYASDSLFGEMCPEKSSDDYNRSSHAYTVTRNSCDWFHEFFPGFSVGTKINVTRAGTFQPIAMKKFTEEASKTSNYLIELLEVMHRLKYGRSQYSATGPLPRERILSHPDVLSKLGQGTNKKLKGLCEDGTSGDDCVFDLSKIPPIYRLSSDGTAPVLLIDPAMVYELVTLIGPSDNPTDAYNRQPSRLSTMLSGLSQSSAYVKTNDTVSALLHRLITTCKSNPNMQGEAAQADCNTRISMLENELRSLERRKNMDRDFLTAQLTFYSEIDRAKSESVDLNHESVSKTWDKPRHPKTLK